MANHACRTTCKPTRSGFCGCHGPAQHADMLSATGSPETHAANTPVRPSGDPPTRIFVRQVLVALGMTGGHGPRSSNWQALAHPKFRWYFIGSQRLIWDMAAKYGPGSARVSADALGIRRRPGHVCSVHQPAIARPSGRQS